VQNRTLIAALAVVLVACGSAEPRSQSGGPEPMPDANDPSYAASFDGEVDPRVSTSAGEPGGMIVLWPRVVTDGSSEATEAGEVQAQLRSTVDPMLNAAAIEVRPEPERVCPQSGCRALAVGAILLKAGTGCAVVATVSQPGETPTQLVEWAGDVELRNTNVPFREPPEQHVQVVDFVPCSDLGTALLAGEPAVAERIRQELSRTQQ